MEVGGQREVVEADDCQVIRHAQTGLQGGAHGGDRQAVRGGEERVWPVGGRALKQGVDRSRTAFRAAVCLQHVGLSHRVLVAGATVLHRRLA